MYQQVYTIVSGVLAAVVGHTPDATKRMPDESRATFLRDNPRPIHPRRIVPNMLRVSAFQLSDPIALFILAKAHDFAIHRNGGRRLSFQKAFPRDRRQSFPPGL